METRFQTSFIPKKTSLPATAGIAAAMPRKPKGGGSIFVFLSVLLFMLSLAAIAGAYGWRIYLERSQDGLKRDLALRESQFDIDKIARLKANSMKIVFARNLLANHVSVSKVFSIISSLTVENIRFTAMEFVASPDGGDFQITLTGLGRDFSTLAFQSQVLNQLEDFGLRATVVKNPIISNPAANQTGTVTFVLTADIAPSSLLYVTPASAAAAVPAADPASAPAFDPSTDEPPQQ